MRWRQAMHDALYGPDGFFVRHRPGDHFRTSALTSELFGAALGRLLCRVDDALGRPPRLDLVDVGAGRGELLAAILQDLDPDVRRRVRASAVEVAPFAPPAGIRYAPAVPAGLTGLLIATEWLDNVPLDLARDGRYLDCDLAPAGPLDPADAAWLARWWPAPPAGGHPAADPDGLEAADGSDGVDGFDELDPAEGIVELGGARDDAWAAAVGRLDRGLALAIDYGHVLPDRPTFTTVTGFRDGRETPARLDGSTDVTCHVAMDSVAAAGRRAAGGAPCLLIRQRAALHALGVRADRPPLALAGADPHGYLRALVAAGEAGELTAPGGLGGHWWLAQAVSADVLDALAG
jgi:SAM-dependent MidA family methyltransferase